MAPPPPVPVPLFPPALPVNIVNDGNLQKALDAAIAAVTIAGKPPKFGLTIIDVLNSSADGRTYTSAGFNQNAEHYAASMMKAACLYAAFMLRDLVTRFNAARKPKSPDELFQLLNKELDPQIAVCCPMITGRAPHVRLPRWRDVFIASGNPGALSVRFTPGYATSLEKMIVPSDNDAAGRCIRGVGYAYLNGLMLKHGFFDDSSNPKTGIWLAGDYGGSDVVTIPCENDGDTKQGTTSAAMARLGLFFQFTSVPGAAEMIVLLEKSSSGPDSSYFTRPEVANHLTSDQVVFGKIGYGPLKSGTEVLSDLNMIVNPRGHGGSFVVCFTNIDQVTYYTAHVLWTFLETVRAYKAAGSTAAAAPTGSAALRATATH
jgi:hypothetical protein